MIPVGGTYTIGAREATRIINQIEPGIVIPMHYKTKGNTVKELKGVEEFLKEFGEEDVKPQDKLTIKAKDLSVDDDRVQVVLMKA